MRSRAVALVLIVASLALACTSRDVRIGSARSMVDAYLTAVRAPEGDRGWSLIHSDIRREAFGDRQSTYVDALAGEDASRLEWRIVEIVPDDPSLHFVWLELPNGPESVPAVLRSFGDFQIVSIPDRALLGAPEGGPTRAQMSVRLDVPLPSGGVWAAGG